MTTYETKTCLRRPTSGLQEIPRICHWERFANILK